MALKPPTEYTMDRARRGHAIVFNHEHFDNELHYPPRTGTQVDADRLYQVLTKLDFTVKILQDQTRDEVKTYIHNLASQNHSDCDCVMIVVLSHGGVREGNVAARDGEYDECMLWNPFLNCPTLAGKPKLFIFQRCRGSGLDSGCYVETDSTTSYDGHRTAVMADFLMAYSSARGYVSWRDSRNGSWFIQTLCDILDTQASALDLLRILVRVTYIVGLQYETRHSDPALDMKKQVPQIISTLTLDVVFKSKLKGEISKKTTDEKINLVEQQRRQAFSQSRIKNAANFQTAAVIREQEISVQNMWQRHNSLNND